MDKWIKAGIAVCVLLVFFGQYSHILYSWFGIDADGYTADMDGKKIAYKLHGAYKQAEINKCWKGIGIDPDNLDNLLKKINSGEKTADKAMQRCIEMQADGYASPKKDFEKLKTFFTGKPEPKLIKSVQYNPRIHGVGGMTVSIPGGYTHYKCSGKYHQIWSDGKAGKFIGCSGIYNDKMPRRAIGQMPIENPKIYGRILVDFKSTTAFININIPQTSEEYSDIYGELTIDFYR